MKKRQATPVPGKQPVVPAEEIQLKVRQRAYELYELRGSTDGRDFEDWIEAESEVIDHECRPDEGSWVRQPSEAVTTGR